MLGSLIEPLIHSSIQIDRKSTIAECCTHPLYLALSSLTISISTLRHSVHRNKSAVNVSMTRYRRRQLYGHTNCSRTVWGIPRRSTRRQARVARGSDQPKHSRDYLEGTYIRRSARFNLAQSPPSLAGLPKGVTDPSIGISLLNSGHSPSRSTNHVQGSRRLQERNRRPTDGGRSGCNRAMATSETSEVRGRLGTDS